MINQNAPEIRRREPNKLATTNITNELADAISQSGVLLGTGQNARRGVGTILVLVRVEGQQDGRTGWYNAKQFFGRPPPKKEDSKNKKALKEADFGEVGKIIDLTLWNPAEATGGSPMSKGDIVWAVLFDYDAFGVPLAVATSAPSPGFFPVIIKSNGGSDGTATTFATWAYDLYALSDTAYATKLNDGAALQPKNSRARIVFGPVTKPADGADGMAYYDKDGKIQLWDLPEKRENEECTP